MSTKVHKKMRRAYARHHLGFTPEEISFYRLEERPIREINRYLSREVMKVYVRPHFYAEAWGPLLNNKLLFDSYYRQFGDLLPTTYGFLHPTVGWTHDGRSLKNIDELLVWLRETGTTSFVLKPVGGSLSSGVTVVRDVDWTADAPIFTTLSGSRIGVPDLPDVFTGSKFGGLEGYLLQERIVPHADLIRLNGHGLHNLRVLTIAGPDGVHEIQSVTLRLAAVGSDNDLMAAGAIAADVDLDTGRVRRAVTKPEFDDHHRGDGTMSDHPVMGLRIPHWDAVRELVLTAAAHTPGIDLVGWDVLIDDVRPRIIEGNVTPVITLSQSPTDGFIGSPVTRTWERLGVDVPDGSIAWHFKHRKRSRSVPARLKRRAALIKQRLVGPR